MPKILVAEDSFALTNLLSFVLSNAGFEVDMHRNGLAARTAGMSTKYDLVLLDQQMPKMTGLEVVQALRSEGPNLQTPICMCTAKSHELNFDEIQAQYSISEVFHKPFSPKDLLEKLTSAIQQAGCSEEGGSIELTVPPTNSGMPLSVKPAQARTPI